MKQSLLVGLLCCCLSAPAYAQLLDVPVALVRLHTTVNIGQRELREKEELLERQLGRELSESDRRQLLDAEISAALIDQDADRLNIRATEEQIEQAIQTQQQSSAPGATRAQFRQAVEEQTNLKWEDFRSQIGSRLIQEQYILATKRALFEGIDPPTASEIQVFYEEYATRFTNPTMVRFEHLFIDTRNSGDARRVEHRERAEQLYEQIRTGSKTFEQLLDESLDDASFSGGDFGYLPRQDPENRSLLGKAFIDALFRITEGRVSTGVLESNVGFHIVKITDRREARLLEIGDPILPGQTQTVRDQIRNLLLLQEQQQLFQQAIGEVVAELQDRAEITIYEQNLDW